MYLVMFAILYPPDSLVLMRVYVLLGRYLHTFLLPPRLFSRFQAELRILKYARESIMHSAYAFSSRDSTHVQVVCSVCVGNSSQPAILILHCIYEFVLYESGETAIHTKCCSIREPRSNDTLGLKVTKSFTRKLSGSTYNRTPTSFPCQIHCVQV